jgi:threonine dehydrogenase-like Zn-dependent dehydrogenase
VLGHEIVGRVLEAGPAVTHVRPGDRVVVQPFLSCASRGHAVACEACREGLDCLCHRTAEGPLAPGMLMGACRDHHGGCFTWWFAGGGTKAGYTHGETDEFSYNIVKDPVHIHDLNATLLHILGLDHERVTFRFQGRDYRLTDVHGKVVSEILA